MRKILRTEVSTKNLIAVGAVAVFLPPLVQRGFSLAGIPQLNCSS